MHATPCRSPLRGRSSRRWILRRRVRLTRDPPCPPSSPWGQGSYVETRCMPPRVGAHSVGEAAGGGFSAGGSGSRGTRRARPLRPGDRAPTGNPLHATPCRSPLRGRSSLGWNLHRRVRLTRDPSCPSSSPWGQGSYGMMMTHATPCRSPLRGRSSLGWILRRRVRLTRDPSCPPSSPWGQGSYVETRCTPPCVGAHSVGEAVDSEPFALDTGCPRKNAVIHPSSFDLPPSAEAAFHSRG
jgi:hypothetical protein